MLLINPKKYPQTNPFQNIKISIFTSRQVRIEIQNFLDKDHQTVNVEHYHIRKVKHNCSVHQLKDTNENVRSLLIEILKEFRR